MSQKYFIDVHDLESGTFNEEHMSEEGFVSLRGSETLCHTEGTET